MKTRMIAAIIGIVIAFNATSVFAQEVIVSLHTITINRVNLISLDNETNQHTYAVKFSYLSRDGNLTVDYMSMTCMTEFTNSGEYIAQVTDSESGIDSVKIDECFGYTNNSMTTQHTFVVQIDTNSESFPNDYESLSAYGDIVNGVMMITSTVPDMYQVASLDSVISYHIAGYVTYMPVADY